MDKLQFLVLIENNNGTRYDYTAIAVHYLSWSTSNYFVPVLEAKYCDDHVCLSVCLSANIFPKLHDQSSSNFMHVTYVGCSVLLWRRCDTLCTSGFMDDVTFAPYARRKFSVINFPSASDV